MSSPLWRSLRGLEKIIEQRTAAKTIGFGADIKALHERDTGEVLKGVLPRIFEIRTDPEFIGRLPVVATLEELSVEALIDILKKPRTPWSNSIRSCSISRM